ncbi:multidrug efflux MFS transporter [Salinibacterium sp. NSLL150]|uniref:MDR family MFS transporter n=1 Tax=unclassified Salinibacterium TaxID=2632331 RepID=UPI0018CD197E|nr:MULTISPECIES: MDR family MFS transporter [unclassified Salinibacterium]MBH0099387.1 multidrug efflux MFS transporter [Salinibacterium sp. NSLL35]MBH0102141.1 multidrug efflux MFS transporter [Salinibacterium sp. NSLL150]MBH0104901.1 multidrug efflux MFS transporter [Salinibacterium sp. NSLL16]MBH0107661.1 multidrug efflux MFS transporter [Salinibacterium sp. NSLL17]MBH0108565.1 multidrug efflux MFS transporter [Salinibacterium sp. NG22]
MTSTAPITGSIPLFDPNDDGPASPVDNSGRNRLVIGLMLAATFVVFLNETSLVVAIPRIMEDLNIEPSTAQWLSTSFMLTMAVVIPITGFLIQRFTTRGIFITAMSLFTIGTLLGAMAPTFAVLIVGRVIQASGTAMMLPLLMTTVMTLVPAATRGKTMGNVSIVMSMAPAVGPTVAGLVLAVFDWRWVFIVMIPISVTALLLGITKVKNVTDPRKVSIDMLSVILSAIAFSGLIYGLSSLGESAAGDSVLIAPAIPISAGAISLVLFIIRQLKLQKTDSALLDLRTFAAPGFAVAIGLMMVMMAALFGTIILLPMFTQNVLGLEPIQSGLLVLPGSLVMGFLSPFVGRLYDKVGPRPLMIPGSILVSASLWSFTLLSETSSPFMVVAIHVPMSIGLAFMFTPLFTSALGTLKPHLYSHGSATISTVQQLAGAAGTALFIALLTVQSVALAAEGAPEATALAGGVRLAFMAGGIISLFAIVATFFVKRPESETAPSDAPVAH